MPKWLSKEINKPIDSLHKVIIVKGKKVVVSK